LLHHAEHIAAAAIVGFAAIVLFLGSSRLAAAHCGQRGFGVKVCVFKAAKGQDRICCTISIEAE
jgi:hypothetical protein